MLVARSKGADAVALMSIYANTGQTFYWLKSHQHGWPEGFRPTKIGDPPGDASRVMWPAFAKAAGLAPKAVTFVDVRPTARGGIEKPHCRDCQHLLQLHDVKLKEFGGDSAR